MSAFEDIRRALGEACPRRKGWVRVVFVGISAQRALSSVLSEGEIAQGRIRLPEKIDGVEVRTTVEFDGWAIRDCDTRGRWHDVEAAA